MKLSTIKKIIIEDFPSEQRKWLPKLTVPLNNFLEQGYKALAKGLTISDNLRAETTRLRILAGETTRKIRWTQVEKPTVCFLGGITYNNGVAPDTVIVMYWTYAEGQITLTFKGLDAAEIYDVVIFAMV